MSAIKSNQLTGLLRLMNAVKNVKPIKAKVKK
jgi:hypothetical protein